MPLPPIYELNLAERKEIVDGMLGRLSPAEQKSFLDWCCKQLPPKFTGTRIEGPILGGKKESWHWLCALCTHYELDFEAARLELERRVRQVDPAKGTLRTIRLLGV